MNTQTYRKYVVGMKSYIVSALLFVAVLLWGYHHGGINWVANYGGSIAAVWSTVYLVYKDQMYWVWTAIYSVLWGILFYQQHLTALGANQFVAILLCISGMVQWYLVKRGIGINWARKSDRWVTVIASIAIGVAIWAYWPTTVDVWWILQITSVLFGLLAIWMDAFRYKMNWIMWILSNLAFWPISVHYNLWAPFAVTFVYTAIDIVGYMHWNKEEKTGAELPLPVPTGTDLRNLAANGKMVVQ